VSARSAQRLNQKRGVSEETRAGKLDFVVRGFGHSIEAEAAVNSAGILASSSPMYREASSAWAVGLRDRVLASRETVVGPFGPGGGPPPSLAQES
jgi:hypothetical protein